jgi:hypothetical protein
MRAPLLEFGPSFFAAHAYGLEDDVLAVNEGAAHALPGLVDHDLHMNFGVQWQASFRICLANLIWFTFNHGTLAGTLTPWGQTAMSRGASQFRFGGLSVFSCSGGFPVVEAQHQREEKFDACC